MEREKTTKPEVGMGCTIGIGSDSYAGTITFISPSGHKLTVQNDKATRTDNNGMSEQQEYQYERNPLGRTMNFTRRKNGGYRGVGGNSYYLVLGRRRQYQDPSY